jgi:hypothetical protein
MCELNLSGSRLTGGHIVVGCEAGFKPRLPGSMKWQPLMGREPNWKFGVLNSSPCHYVCGFDRLRHGLPDSVTVAQQILVLFVQVRILVG